VDTAALLSTADVDARGLLAVAEADWARPVPHCPDWDMAGLVRHTGGIFLWMAAIVASGDRVNRRTLNRPPEQPEELAGWYIGALEETLTVLGSAEPDAATWTFSTTGDRRVGWWCRRLAVEVAIHRWDAQDAAAVGGTGPAPLDREVAVAGVEEFVVEFLPGLLAQEGIVGLHGTLHLHATDWPAERWIDLAGGGALPEHAKADATIRGTASDVLLWLTNRGPLDTLEVLGDREIAARWGQLRR
jgi:uncharacterized protein (TIGR03083 family)